MLTLYSGKMYRRQGYAKVDRRVRGKKVTGVSKMRRLGVEIEGDVAADATAARTVYIGHYTHPAKNVLNIIGYALAKYIGGVVSRHHPTSLNEVVGGQTASAGSQFSVVFYYRTTLENETLSSAAFAVTAGMDYATFGEGLRDLIYNITPATNANETRIERIMVEQLDDNIGGRYLMGGPMSMQASEIKIAITGISSLKIQNTTLADALGSTDKHDINANPVEGKEYFGKGSYFPLRRQPLGASNADGHLYVDADTGVFSFDGQALPTSTDVKRILEFPPQHGVWRGLSNQRSVRMQPGTISHSRLQRTHLLSLNRWIGIYKRALGALNHGLHQVSSVPTSIGFSRWFGVDKLIHDATDDVTKLSYECHLRVIGCVFRKKKKAITAAYPVLDAA